MKNIKQISALLLSLSVFVSVLPNAVAEDNTPPSPPSGLLTNELTSPDNVENPVFSWIVNDTDRNEIQSAYEIVVSDAISKEEIWNSGKVTSSEQSYISYGGKALQDAHSYVWKVRTWDKDGEASDYSDSAEFSMGISNNNWDAMWIKAADIGNSKNIFRHFRKETNLGDGKTVAKALAYVACCHDYELNVNGVRIGRGQSFDYLDKTDYQGWDITDAVKGNNDIAIGITARWYGGGQGRYEGTPGLLGKIKIYYTDGTEQSIVTDRTWKTSSTPFGNGGSKPVKRNSEGDFTEVYNAMDEKEGWTNVGYDDSTWTAALEIGAHPIANSFSYVEPELGHVTEYDMKPVSVKTLGDGSTVADFGKVIPARFAVSFNNGKAGTELKIQTGYELKADGSIDTSMQSRQSTDMSFTYTQKDGKQTYYSWDHLGFRYLQIPYSGEELTADNITAKIVHAEIPQGRETTLKTSDEMLDSVYEMLKNSGLYSAQNTFVDTPTREKGQFLNDSINISAVTMNGWYERATTKKAIMQFLDSADRYWNSGDDLGRYNSVYPNCDGKRDIPDFTINMPEWVLRYYMATGDRELLETAYPYLKETGNYITRNISSNTGLVTMLAGGDGSPNSYQYGIVDWPADGRFGYDWNDTKEGARTTVNMLSVNAFSVIAKIAEILDNNSDKADFTAREEKLKTSINEKLINSDGVYCDGLDKNGTQVASAAQHSTSYALAFDVAPEDKKEKMIKYVSSMGMKQGPMTADILINSLFKSDKPAAALKLLTNTNDVGWAKLINDGYSFTWEAWQYRNEYSQSHGWGAAALKPVVENIAGVTVTAAGASKVKIAPAYGILDSMSAKVATERGNVKVEYSGRKYNYILKVSVPANVTAEIELPVIGDGEFKEKNGFKLSSKIEGDCQKINAGSGEYEFIYDGNIFEFGKINGIKAVSKTEESIVYNVDVSGSGTLVTAVYDESGVLLHIETDEVGEGIMTKTVDLNKNTKGTTKFMLWNGLDTMKPLSESCEHKWDVSMFDIIWDFSKYTSEVSTTESGFTEDYNGLKIAIANNGAESSHDSISKNGVYWRGGASSDESARYIEYTPSADGILYASGKLNSNGGRWGISKSRDVSSLASDNSSSASTSVSEVMLECTARETYYILTKAKSATINKVWFTPSSSSKPPATPSATTTPIVSPSPSPTATAKPTSSPSPSPTLTPTASPTQTPTTEASPSPTPDENVSNHWDFKAYSGNAAINNITEIKNELYKYTENSDILEIGLNSGDSITENGIVWNAPSGTKSDGTTIVSNNRCIKYTPSADGVLSVTYKGSANASNKHPRMYVSCGNSLDCTTKEKNDSQLEANQSFDNNSTDFKTAEFKLSKGKTYYIWSYYFNNEVNQFTISDIAFNKAEQTIRTRNIYGSNMLLQRNQPVVIDGKADAVDTVSVTLTNEKTNEVVQTAEDNTVSSDNSWNNKDWSVTLDAVSDYSSTYKLSISAQGAEPIEYTNIIFGDLYLFSGQSNMWKQVSYYKNIDKAAYGTDAVATNATDKIRVLHTAGSSDYGTNILQYDAKGAQAWRDFSIYDNISDIAAPAYTAAIKMHKEIGVPIGLITNAYPGSYISSWFDSALKIDACNECKGGSSNERNWYCGRIYPLRNLNLSGIFWYQGEADASTKYHDNPYEYYSEMLPKLIDTWRELFRNDKLPFYYVQLSRIGSTIVDENNPDTGNAGKMPIKRAQTDVYLNMADKTNVGIISTLDLYGNHNANGTANCRNDIHLGQKNIVGERMAAYALKDIYGKDVYSHGPIYKSSKLKDGKIIVIFDCSGQLKIMPSAQYTDTIGEEKISGGEINPNILNEFEIAGEDGVWHTAQAEITADNQITVSSEQVPNPVKVRYCGTDYPESPNLTDASGLPSYVFEKTAENSGDTEETPSPIPTPTSMPTVSPSPTPTIAPSASQSPLPSPTTEPTVSASPTPNITATYKFDFGSSEPAEGYTAVTADMVYDMSKADASEGYCGFLGTTENSYANDVLGYDCDNRAIDGFSLVKGQQIILSNGGTASNTDADSDYITVPSKDSYIPVTASEYEGRFPIRFSMKADRKSYYTVTATLTNSSGTEDACVSLLSEKRQIVAEDVTIHPNEKIIFRFNVDIEDKKYKNFNVKDFTDDMLNISVSGKNAAISSLIVEKHGKTEGTIKGATADGGVNDGVTMWLCTDSTGCDYGAKVPFFALQSYGGVGQALLKYMPENIAVSNQGEGGLATGDSSHFGNCMLKQGDYLYVQYGHNENGTDLYKQQLEKYYDMAHKSGAKMILVSPINRHKSGDFKDGKWQSSFGGYVNAGHEFVNAKIDAGAKDIAFVDMNTLYVEWMNRETERITSVNSSIPAQSAINFYYYSAKGGIVDGAHINDAGADQGAYYFFEAAKNIVKAADEDTADKYTLAQAEVVRPLAEGMKTKIGNSELDNRPMTVSDEIIKAGIAPNSYWDAVPSDAFEYDNSVAVDSVKTIGNVDGSMEISEIGIRIMNTITYAKAVVTVNDNGVETKYYTENNYDCTGVQSGKILTNSGFIAADKNHNEVTDSDKTSVVTVPQGASCSIQVFECDEYWVVGENRALSAVYVVYPEEKTIFDENGSSTDGWNILSGVSSHSETVTDDTDGSKYFAIYSSGVDSSNTKKNYGFYKALNEDMSSGKYRMSFKTRFGAGVIRFALVNSTGSASNPFKNKVYPLAINTGKIYMNTNANPIYTLTNDGDVKEGKINANQWVNVDSIIDLNNGKLYISVAGSDYAEFDIAGWQKNNSDTLPIKFFGIAGDSEGSSTNADVKDIKIVKLHSETASKTITARANDDAYGSVTINDENTTEISVEVAQPVTITASANSGYRFVSWTDEEGNILSQSETYTISRVYTDTSIIANFEELSSNTKVWDFSGYTTEVNTTKSGFTENYDGLTIAIANNGADSDHDKITTAGVYWRGGAASGESVRYIAFTPEKDGTLTASGKMKTSGGRWGFSTSKDVGTLKADGSSSTSTSESTVTIQCTAGTTYYIINKSKAATINNISYTPSE